MLRRHQSGQVMILVAAGLVALIGLVGLACDIGFLYSTRRQMQTAADAAAIAAANALQTSDSADYATVATNVATLDGFTNNQNGVTVTVGAPAVGCPGAASKTCLQVTVAQAVPTFFLGVIGYSTVNVSAQATAGSLNGPACIYALDPSAAQAISMTGNINLDVSCGLMDNSSSASALYVDGNITVTTTSTGVAGGVSKTGNITFSPNPITGIAPALDPLGSLASPSPTACAQATPTATSGSYSSSPASGTLNVPVGVYSGNITIGGNPSTVNFTAGTYAYGANGITVNGNITTVNFAAGNYGNGISIGGNVGTANLNPGQYQNGGGSGNSIYLNGNVTTILASGSYTFCGPFTVVGNDTVTLQPGLYYGGISITGNANVTFGSGTYILAGGGLSITGNSTITGTGVTFYNTTGLGGYKAIDLTGNESATLSAPTSGPMEGILFFQDRTIPVGSAGSTVEGNAASTFNGALYFSTTSLKYLGNSSVSGYTLLIADTLQISGNSSIGDNYSSLANGSPISSNALYQ